MQLYVFSLSSTKWTELWFVPPRISQFDLMDETTNFVMHLRDGLLRTSYGKICQLCGLYLLSIA